MVPVDYSLIYEARHLATRVNVHQIRTLIYRYEQAVYEQANGRPYDFTFEGALRDFIQVADPTKTLPRSSLHRVG
jgi:hypothetical protein